MAKLSLARRAFLLCAAFLLAVPFPALAFLPFGGWVTNVPGAGGIMSTLAASGFIYPPCINGVQEVDVLSPPRGIKSPPVMLQFMGAYTFLFGPARSPGQAIIGRYIPAMVCIAIFLMPCTIGVCPTPLPAFFAPLIIFNGSSPM